MFGERDDWTCFPCRTRIHPCQKDDLAKLSKVKAKIEVIGDYQYMEKLRDVLKELGKK
jgi:hypothetical protein